MVRLVRTPICPVLAVLAVTSLSGCAATVTAQCPNGSCGASTGGLSQITAYVVRKFERCRKSTFEHYAHNPGDLVSRPICPPYCSPSAGYFEPCWRRLPPSPACSSVYVGGTSGSPSSLVPMPAPPLVHPGGEVPMSPLAPPAPYEEPAPADLPTAPETTEPELPAIRPTMGESVSAPRRNISNKWREAAAS